MVSSTHSRLTRNVMILISSTKRGCFGVFFCLFLKSFFLIVRALRVFCLCIYFYLHIISLNSNQDREINQEFCIPVKRKLNAGESTSLCHILRTTDFKFSWDVLSCYNQIETSGHLKTRLCDFENTRVENKNWDFCLIQLYNEAAVLHVLFEALFLQKHTQA